MTTEKMTIHEALAELKVIGKRISKEISSTTFVTANKHSNTKIDGKTIPTYKDDVKAQYQKIIDLINRRKAIKRAVVNSNATTKIVIDGMEMSVAEAIEYKDTGIEYERDLLSKLTSQYNICLMNIRSNNGDSLEEKANDYVQKLFGNDKANGVDSNTIETTKKSFIESNTFDMIDSISINKTIEELKDKIDKFETKVDSALSISNATTIIEINY